MTASNSPRPSFARTRIAQVLMGAAAASLVSLAWAQDVPTAIPQAAEAQQDSTQPQPVSPQDAAATAEPVVEATANTGDATTAAAVPTIPVAPTPAEEPQAPTVRQQPALMQEIIVTARKRNEPLQTVPISVAAFSGEQLDALGVTEVRDLQNSVPGLQFTDLAGYNLISLRGIGTDAFIPSADPSIATYLDGLYFPSGHSIAQSFGALERVEVLKGPQGTLFGRNSTGGSVNLWTKDPGQEEETSIQASYGRFNDAKARIYTNIPLSDDFAASLSGFYNRADNYYDWEYPLKPAGEELSPEIGKGARVKVGYKPSDDLSIVLTGLVLSQRGSSTTTSANTRPSALLGGLIPAETRDYVVTANTKPTLWTNTRAFYGNLKWDNDAFDTKLLGSYYYINAYNYQYDFDGSALPIATYAADSEFQRIVTGELQFTSKKDGLGPDWLKWVGGLYYLKSKGGYDPGYLRLVDALNLPLSNLIDVGALPSPLGDLLGALPAPGSATFFFTGLIGAESYSTYAQATAEVTDWFDITAGGRYQVETRTLIRSDVGVGSLDSSPATLIPWGSDHATVHNFSPRVSLDFHPAKDVLLYGSFAQGFKSATYNIINIYTPPDYIKPERVSTYEVGLKSEWLDHTLRFNAAVFESDINNLQTGFVSFTSGGAINFNNAGEARVRGVEFETLWQPLPELDRGLLINASATWLDAKYTDYTSGYGYDETTGLSFQCQGNALDNGSCPFTGNRIVRTPKFSGTLGLSQQFNVPGGTLEVAGNYYYNSGYYYLPQNSENSFEPAYDLISARISYLYEPQNLRITIFGENLGDERYNISQFHTDFGREDTLAPPITYGVRVNWDF